MDCSCEELRNCLDKNSENEGSDILTLWLLCFILLITYIQSCIEENNN